MARWASVALRRAACALLTSSPAASRRAMNRSCRATTVGQLYQANLVREYSGVPCLMLESDMCDVRDYIETEWKDKIVAFLETVDVHKEARRHG